MPRPVVGAVVVVPYAHIPDCDFCPPEDMHPGVYDFRTFMGPWASGCEEHWRKNRASPRLGVGRGQLWITEDQVSE